MVIYLAEKNSKWYGITFQNKECVKVLKLKVISNDEINIMCVKPLRTFLVKTEVCDMTLMSGALDKSVFDGKTILLKISEECDRHRYLYIGGEMLCSFLISDVNRQYIPNMENILTHYSIALGDENIYFLTPLFKLIRRERIDYNKLLKTND